MVRIVKKPEERRREIIAAAQELFRQKNYDNTTIQDVMEKLGVAKGTIYHYFKSKEELLIAVIDQSVEDYIAGMQNVLDEAEGTGLDKLRTLITASDVSDDQEGILEVLHRPGNIGIHTRQMANTISKLAPLYEDVIRQGCEEGVFQTDHPLECAEFLLAGIQFLTDMGFYPWSQEELARRGMAFPALIEAQLNAPQGSFDFLLNQI